MFKENKTAFLSFIGSAASSLLILVLRVFLEDRVQINFNDDLD